VIAALRKINQKIFVTISVFLTLLNRKPEEIAEGSSWLLLSLRAIFMYFLLGEVVSSRLGDCPAAKLFWRSSNF
jgi:hypothetical protein